MLNTVEKFLTSQIAKGNATRTVETYSQRLRLLMEFTEEKSLDGYTPELIDRWVAAERVRGLAVATVNSRLRDVRTFFAWCETRGYVDQSPAKHISIKRQRGYEIKAIDPIVLGKLLEAADTERDRAIVLFIASTGCRSGEAATLRRGRLDVNNREAYVVGKTGGRWVDFDRNAARALGRWLAIAPPSAYVFTGLHSPNNGEGIKPGTIYQLFRRLAMRADVMGEIWNPHSLRHRVGQQFCTHGNLELARQKLGHADITSTLVYANQDRAMVRAATDRISIL